MPRRIPTTASCRSITSAGTSTSAGLDCPSSALPADSRAKPRWPPPGTATDIRTVTYEGQSYRVLTEGGLHQTSGTPVAIQIARPLADIEHTLARAPADPVAGHPGRDRGRPWRSATWSADDDPPGRAADRGRRARRRDPGPGLDDRRWKATTSSPGWPGRSTPCWRALAASRQQQAQLISDAGHELRTPLTSLRTNIEVLLRVKDLPDHGPGRSGGRHTSPAGGDDDPGRRRRRPGPGGRGPGRADRGPPRRHRRAGRRAGPPAGPGVTFESQLTPGSVRAQPALLERAVLNVLDNAAKWSPPGGVVRVRLRRERGRGRSTSSTRGPGSPPATSPRVRPLLPGRIGPVPARIRARAGHRPPGRHRPRWQVTATSPPAGGTLVHIELPTVAEQEPASAAGASEPFRPGAPGEAPVGTNALVDGWPEPPAGVPAEGVNPTRTWPPRLAGTPMVHHGCRRSTCDASTAAPFARNDRYQRGRTRVCHHSGTHRTTDTRMVSLGSPRSRPRGLPRAVGVGIRPSTSGSGTTIGWSRAASP